MNAPFDPALPLEQASSLPARYYRDPAVAEAEARRVFGASWCCVGRLDQLDRPGAFLTAELGGEPVVVIRGLDGQLRARSNVCRHRGALLLTEPEGQRDRLRCRYHGWTYDLAGRLRATPEWEGVADFCKDQHGLPAHAVDTWGPWVWVHLGAPVRPLAEQLAPLPERFPAAALAALRFTERRVYSLACNWKVFVDNYLDGGYHVNTVHPGLAGVLDYRGYRTETFGWSSLQSSPLRQGELSAVRGGEVALYGWVFPNFMLNLYEGVMDTNLVLPRGPDRCEVQIDLSFAPGAERVAESVAAAHQIQLEDVGVCEDVQRGLCSRFYQTGRYSAAREAGTYHFHRLLFAHLGADSAPETG